MIAHQFDKEIEMLRSQERIKLLEVERVVELCLEKIYITKVLDIGTGSGLFAEAFSLRRFDVTAVDNDPEMLKAANGFAPRVHFQKASSEALPFQNHSFDLVFLGHLLHESNNPEQVLREARRAAAARVVVLEWPFKKEEIGPPIEHRLKPEKIKKLTVSAGFPECEIITLSKMVLYRMNV